MATGKRYYWIKLKDDFMGSDTVDYIMSQENGAEYIVLYQMLCLKTVNTSGRLSFQIGEVIIPYDEEKIQRDCKWFSIETIQTALELYKKVGLVYVDVDGILVLSEHENIIGTETDYATQKKTQRQTQNKIIGVDNVHSNVHSNVHIEKEKEKEKDNIKKKNIKKKNSFDDILSTVSDEGLRNLYVKYIEMRNNIKSPMTDYALTLLINKNNELAPNDITKQKQLLEVAILNNWKSVYVPNEQNAEKYNKAKNKDKFDLLKKDETADEFERIMFEKLQKGKE